ncbi:MAG: hypothetical protein E7105_09005 [Prevotella sp.]|nr:hypothetical protein [Prevotella sp.]
MALQHLIHDGGHTRTAVSAGLPEGIEADYMSRMKATVSKYPEAAALYYKWEQWMVGFLPS